MVVVVVVVRRAIAGERRDVGRRHQIAVHVPHVHHALAVALAEAFFPFIPIDRDEAICVRGVGSRRYVVRGGAQVPAGLSGRFSNLAVQRRVAPAHASAPIRRRGTCGAQGAQ